MWVILLLGIIMGAVGGITLRAIYVRHLIEAEIDKAFLALEKQFFNVHGEQYASTIRAANQARKRKRRGDTVDLKRLTYLESYRDD